MTQIVDFDISVIVPVYNVEQYISECLQSVMDQDLNARIECLVVDDCGNDNSMEVARETIANYHGSIEFRIITRDANGGLSAARNTGIREARGRYVYFLDSDDLIPNDSLTSLFASTIRYPEVQMVVGSLRTFPEEGKYDWMIEHIKEYPSYSNDTSWIRNIYFFSMPIISCNKLIQRNFILANNLFFREGVLHEDEHWAALSYPYIRSISFVNNVTYLYRQRQGSITVNQNTDLRKLQNMTVILSEMFERHTQWDAPLINWARSWLFFIRAQSIKDGIGEKALISWNILMKKLLGNMSIPLLARLAFRYCQLLPNARGCYLVFRPAFKMYPALKK